MKIRGKKLKGRTRYTSSTKVRITMAFWKCEIRWLYNFLIHRTSFHYFVERIKMEKNSQWHFTPPAISECTPRELRYLLLELCPRLLVYFGCHCCWVASVVSDSVRPQRRQPTRLPRPWDAPGKSTGVGCHLLLPCMKVKSLSCVWLFATPWTAAHQAPASMGFSRQEHWSGVPLPSPCWPLRVHKCTLL